MPGSGPVLFQAVTEPAPGGAGKKMFYKSSKNAIIEQIDDMAGLFHSNSPVPGLIF